MKTRTLVVMLVLLALCSTLASCASEPPISGKPPLSSYTPYTVYEVGGYDSVGTMHNNEYPLVTTYVEEFKLFPQKLVSIDGQNYLFTYKETREGFYYQSDFENYTYGGPNNFIDISFSKASGKLISCHRNIPNDSQQKGLSRDQCVGIAKNFLGEYIDDPEAYVVTTEYYRDYSKLGSAPYYDLELRRMVDGMLTFDSAYISVTVYGEVFSYSFPYLGQMRDVSVPSSDELETIQQLVDEKLDAIYGTLKETKTVNWELQERILSRMKDGTYALEYIYDVDIIPNSTDITIGELTHLIVLLNDL